MATQKKNFGINNGHISDSAGIRPHKMDLVFATEALFLAAKGKGRNSASEEDGDWFYDSTEKVLKVYNGSVWMALGEDAEELKTLAFADDDVPTARTIAVDIQAEADTAGNALAVSSGAGLGTGAGGAASVTAGAGGATGAGGASSVVGGAGGATSGTGGAAAVTGGAGSAGNSAGGAVTATGGAGSGNLAGGAVSAVGGAGGATGAGGAIVVTSGAGGATSGASGTVTVASGAVTDGSGSASGAVAVQSAAGATHATTTAGAGGAIGVTAGAGGECEGGSGDGGAGGSITLTPGAGGATAGGTAGADGAVIVGGAKALRSSVGATYLYPVMIAAAGETIAAGTGGAVSVATSSTLFAVDAGGDALTLADGSVPGQIKRIQMTATAGGTGVLTPVTLTGGTTITFTTAGEFALLMWDGSSWDVLELNNVADGGATPPVVA